ncbi:MipA/OmpV family protein [Agaribacterium haliotis]|uniref:MipA/OmpV family protein n=1 Tax=Agaribacterium haliotis TaxID=2013869 RepID=UPI000BB59158|nr:MipA/OmpV family protein [Agaribacterium haliotis]
MFAVLRPFTLLFLLLSYSAQAEWYVAVAPGLGQRTQALVGQDDQPLYLNVDFAWYGKRFFFDNTDVGVFVLDGERWSWNVLAELNDERGVLSDLADMGISIGGLAGVESYAADAPEPVFSPAPADPIESDQVFGDGDSFGPQLVPDPQPDAPSEEPELKQPTTDERLAGPQQLSMEISLPDRDQSVLGGTEFLYELGSDSSYWGDVYVAALTDISDKHRGNKIKLAYAYNLILGRWHVQPGFELNWLDARLANYYFGFDAADSGSDDLQYQPGASLNSEYSILINYALSPRLFWGTSYRYKRLDASIVDSPIVEDDAISTFFTGLKYKF